MMSYPPTGYIMFSLKKLKFYGDRGLGTGGGALDMRAGGRGPDNTNILTT